MVTIGRNDLCPCGSSKKFKKCCMQTRQTSVSWVGDDGIHVMTPGGNNPTPEELDKLTKDYQNKIRKSPMWSDMVSKFLL